MRNKQEGYWHNCKAAARKNQQARAAVEALFEQFEQGGWRIVEADSAHLGRGAG